MFEKIPRDIKVDAVIMREKGVKCVQVAAAFEISKSTLGRAMRNKEKFGDVEAKKQKPGPKAMFPPGIQDVFPLFDLETRTDNVRHL